MTVERPIVHLAQPTTGGVAEVVLQLVEIGVADGRRVVVGCPADGYLADRARALGADLILGARLREIIARDDRVTAIRCETAKGLIDLACDGVVLTGRWIPEISALSGSGIAVEIPGRHENATLLGAARYDRAAMGAKVAEVPGARFPAGDVLIAAQPVAFRRRPDVGREGGAVCLATARAVTVVHEIERFPHFPGHFPAQTAGLHALLLSTMSDPCIQWHRSAGSNG